MDSFAKKYLATLLIVVVAASGYWILTRDTRVVEINRVLAADPELAAYPYPFRVQQLANGVATLSSPRSAQVPVMRFLRTAFPALRMTPVDDPAMMAAQATLVEKHSRAAALVEAEPDVSGVRWSFDERWFNEHGVFLDL